MRCVDLSMLMRIDDTAGLVPFTSPAPAVLADFSSQTSALSFHAILAASQSARVKGCGLETSATPLAVSQTLDRSLHDHPGVFSQSARVKG